MDWLYYTLYARPAALDKTIATAIAPAVLVAHERTGVQRWFFLRFADELGTHIRLRFGGATQALNALERELTPALEAAVTATATTVTNQHVGCFLDLYEPEYEKFGGVAGLCVHERVFQASSELALGAVTLRRARRLALGAQLMHELASYLDAEQAESLWPFIWRYWCGGGASGLARQARARRVAAASAEALEAEATAALAVPELAHAARGYVHAVGDAFKELERLGVPHDRRNLCFHHIHLTNNRLGIAIAEEACLGAWLMDGDGRSRR